MTGGSKLFGRKSTQALTNAPILLKEKRHALTRSYSSSCGPLWATVYGSYLEETDDVTDRNQAFAWTPHGLRRLTAERRSRQRAFQPQAFGQQSWTAVDRDGSSRASSLESAALGLAVSGRASDDAQRERAVGTAASHHRRACSADGAPASPLAARPADSRAGGYRLQLPGIGRGRHWLRCHPDHPRSARQRAACPAATPGAASPWRQSAGDRQAAALSGNDPGRSRHRVAAEPGRVVRPGAAHR